jgi:hypothetical protein
MSVSIIYGVNNALRYESPFQKMFLFKETAILIEDITTKISHIFVHIIDSAIEENNICEYGNTLGLLCERNEITNRVSLKEIMFNFLSDGYIHLIRNDILHKSTGIAIWDDNYEFVVLFGYCFPNRISQTDIRNFTDKVHTNYNANIIKIYTSCVLDKFVGCAVFQGCVCDNLDKIKTGFKVSDYEDWRIKDVINKYADECGLDEHVCGPPMLIFELIN